MSRTKIINHTIETLQKLSKDKAIEVAEFAEFLLKKQEDQLLHSGLNTLEAPAENYALQYHEEDSYTLENLKESF